MKKFLFEINEIEQNNIPYPSGFFSVNLKFLEKNIIKIKNFCKKKSGKIPKYLFPIKGNGYGSGIIPLAKFIEKKSLCDMLGVSSIQEAYELRGKKISLPILLLTAHQASEKNLNAICELNIQPSISSKFFLKELIQKAEFLQKNISVHLKIDIGMGRGGIFPKEIFECLDKIFTSKFLSCAGVMIHFPVSDSEDPQEVHTTKKQIEKFSQIKKQVEEKFSQEIIKQKEKILFHAANSGGVLEHPESIFDMIRPGIATYGYPEKLKKSREINLKPIMEIYSHISLVKNFPENHSIGYGQTYHTKYSHENIGLVPLGYADGLSRSLSNQSKPYTQNQVLQSVGRVSMDQFAVTGEKKLAEGEKITILGEKFSAHDSAKIQKTISYEALCNLGNSGRIRHIYTYTNKFL